MLKLSPSISRVSVEELKFVILSTNLRLYALGLLTGVLCESALSLGALLNLKKTH